MDNWFILSKQVPTASLCHDCRLWIWFCWQPRSLQIWGPSWSNPWWIQQAEICLWPCILLGAIPRLLLSVCAYLLRWIFIHFEKGHIKLQILLSHWFVNHRVAECNLLFDHVDQTDQSSLDCAKRDVFHDIGLPACKFSHPGTWGVWYQCESAGASRQACSSLGDSYLCLLETAGIHKFSRANFFSVQFQQ